MKKLLILLMVLYNVQVFAENPSSENYILQQYTISSGNDSANPPTSENYILQYSTIGNISGDEQNSENYTNFPGYYLGEIFGEILPPQNVTISVSGGNVYLSWDAVAGATSYKVYSSDDPEIGFTEDTTGTFSGASWSALIPDGKKFYYVKAVQ